MPIAPKRLVISEAARELPRARGASSTDIEKYLRRGLKQLGAGIPTLIWMLAVESVGAYPPMDRKFASGLRAKGEISAQELEHLTGGHVRKFAKAYVAKVNPGVA